MFLVSLAEGFIHLFQAAGKIFLDMMTGLIPMLICLLLAINFLMKLVGIVRMEKVAALLGRSRILTYGVLPVLGWFFMSSPGALTLGKLLPEKSKPGYEDALGTTAHPLTSLFPHVVPSELFVWLGVAAGVKALGLPVTSLALRYIAAAMLIGLIRGIITEYLFLRLSKRGECAMMIYCARITAIGLFVADGLDRQDTHHLRQQRAEGLPRLLPVSGTIVPGREPDDTAR
ncbi:PTS system glucitol/sorbitol-specific transporter subunit IIC [Klebsiella pneumoniae]|nr:PTS system glucitol/sorbitol-specific transporter subunit IIC [Klebsiella pneumoniae]